MCKSAHAALEDLENKVAEARENTRGWATALGDVADGVNEQFPAKVREHCAITQRMLADAVDGMLEVEFLLREFYAAHPSKHSHTHVEIDHSHADAA